MSSLETKKICVTEVCDWDSAVSAEEPVADPHPSRVPRLGCWDGCRGDFWERLRMGCSRSTGRGNRSAAPRRPDAGGEATAGGGCWGSRRAFRDPVGTGEGGLLVPATESAASSDRCIKGERRRPPALCTEKAPAGSPCLSCSIPRDLHLHFAKLLFAVFRSCLFYGDTRLGGGLPAAVLSNNGRSGLGRGGGDRHGLESLRWTARLAVLILPEPMKETPKGCKTAEDEAKLGGTILVMLDVKVPDFKSTLGLARSVVCILSGGSACMDIIGAPHHWGALLVSSSFPHISCKWGQAPTELCPNQGYFGGCGRTKYFRVLPIRLRSLAAAFETSQRQAMMPMRSTERPTGKFSTMIFNTLGTTVPPGAAPVPQTAAMSRADQFGKISQPLKNNKTKLSNRPQFDWRMNFLCGGGSFTAISELLVVGASSMKSMSTSRGSFSLLPGLVLLTNSVGGVYGQELEVSVLILRRGPFSLTLTEMSMKASQKRRGERDSPHIHHLFLDSHETSTVEEGITEPIPGPSFPIQGGEEDTDKGLSAQGEYKYKLTDAAERLAAISSQNHLRGHKKGSADSGSLALETIRNVKDILLSKISHLKTIQKLILEIGDVKVLSNLLFSFIDDTIRAGKALWASPGSDKELSDMGADLALGFEGEDNLGIVDYLAGMDRKELSSTVTSNELIGHMEFAANTLTDIEETLSPRPRRTSGSIKTSKSKARLPPNLRSATKTFKIPRASLSHQHWTEKRSYRPLPNLKQADRLRAAAGVEGRRHLEEETVAPQCFDCKEDNVGCNCRRLKECSLELTWYDVATRMVGGFIDSDPDSDTYGQLLVDDMNDIDVFDARNKLSQKMAEIKRLADADLPVNEANCAALLSELVTACGEGSCSNPNEKSFQLSVNEVCQAKDTLIKFGIEAMGRFFDFRNFATTRKEKIVFVTSTKYEGYLGGSVGADAKCQERADAAELPGTYKAWLSLSGGKGNSVSGRFDRNYDNIPFFRTDGVKVANDWADLTDGTLLEAINRDEFGSSLYGVQVWTFTLATGFSDPSVDTCPHRKPPRFTYTGTVGRAGMSNYKWSNDSRTLCDTLAHLYCFQQQPPLVVPDPNIAWFKSGTFELDSMSWPNAVGDTHATLSGDGMSKVSKSGHGAAKEVTALEGTTADSINFGDVLRNQFTICSVTRYTGGTFGRILNGEGANWLHGHLNGKAGIAFYIGWKTQHDGTNVAPVTDWVVMCGTNAGSQLKLVNGVSKGTEDGGSVPQTLWINGGFFMPRERSDFAIAEVMVWDRGLTSEEMYGASDYLLHKFGICDPALSHVMCGEFITGMEALYGGTPETFARQENPLRRDKGVAARSNFENVDFPTEFKWKEPNNKGSAKIDEDSPYQYGFAGALSSNQGDIFAAQGPPSTLMQACDASVDFLLGSKASIGLLSSTAKAVNVKIIQIENTDKSLTLADIQVLNQRGVDVVKEGASQPTVSCFPHPNIAWFKSGTFELDSKSWPNAVGDTHATLSGEGMSKVSKSGHGAAKE
ncbi:hypothetical protein THAOC_34199, partial [Thalassiosira oceanica]